MKLYCSADLHLRAVAPVNRIDDYVAEQQRKVEFIINHAYENPLAPAIIWGGDIYDHHDVPYWVTERYINVFKSRKTYLYDPQHLVVFGQHDQRFHTSDKVNTPLGTTLAGVEVMKLLWAEPVVFENAGEKPVHIYGMSWGQNIPGVITTDNVVNILVAHMMTTENGPLWPGHEGFTKASDFLKDHPEFNYVVTGDNHQQFVTRYRGRQLINPGPVMRTEIDKVDFEPAFFILDTVSGEVERVPFLVTPGSEVFSVAKVQESKERDERLETFIMSLKGNQEETLSFRKNLTVFMEKNKLDEPVVEAIQEIMR